MEISWDLFNVTVFALFLTWVLIEFFEQKGSDSEDRLRILENEKKCIVFRLVILSNIITGIFYLIFCVYKSQRRQNINASSIFPGVSWFLASIVTVHRKETILLTNVWPKSLKFWWFVSFFLNTLLIIIYCIKQFKLSRFQSYFPLPNLPDIASFPFSCFICTNVLTTRPSRKLQEIEHPLLIPEHDKNLKTDPYTGCGTWSCITFRWLNRIFQLGQTQKLELHHIPQIPNSETAEDSFIAIQKALCEQKAKDYSLQKAIYYAIWKPLAINAICAGINTISSYMGPLLITYFVNFLSEEHDSSRIGYGHLLAFLFFFFKTIESLSQRQWYFGARRIGIRVRAALMVYIYHKCLSMKNSDLINGKIVNLINVDVERIGDFFWYAHGIWLLPIQVSLALIILYKNLGLSASLAALLATVVVMVSNTPLASLQERLHCNIMKAKDSRIKAMSETLKCMRILKLHSWETEYLNKILKLREAERYCLKKYLYTCSAVAFLFWASPTLVSVVTFGVCIIVKTPLVSSKVLSALATFRILQEPIYNLPELISMIAQTKVSLDRIQEFIGEEDPKKFMQDYSSKHSEVAIKVETGEYAWEINSNSNRATVVIDKAFTINRGQKIAVCGSVGSGKSSFLCSLMNEIPKIRGTPIKVFGTKAFVSQSAWIQTGTIQENILFGKKMDKDFYKEVLQVCCLDRDIEIWANGDNTEVGERGLNLSGGQKQRIQLARAIYSNSDIYLLDDPFSAVDVHTGAHLFKECLMRLLSDKTVIYATHQLEFLNTSDFILVVKDGKIVQSGKYHDLLTDTDGELVRLIAAHNQSINQVSPSHDHNLTLTEDMTIHSELMEEKSEYKGGKQIHETIKEDELGRVKWHVYSTFVTLAYKGALVPIILLCQILFQGLQMGSNYWIAWATEEDGKVSKGKMIGIFVLLSSVSSVFILGRAVLLATITIETAQRLFIAMTTSVFRAPISFFDATPSSRILNRSSSDQNTVDIDIPYRVAGLAFALVQLLCIIILMCQVAWPVILLFAVVLAISVWYQAYYITAARELARMVAIRKSPILHHFSESIFGAATIRCFNQEDRFCSKNLSLIDDYSRLTFYNSATMEWLSVRINFLFNLAFFIVLIILVSLPKAAINPSLAGLAATYGLNLNVLQAWVIWNLCNVENKMISVERILQFINIPSEAPLIIENCRPEQNWPMKGTIELDNLHVQYSPRLPMVLKGITCTFPGEKKIGVVGRTGSGKSTLIQALFRVVEPSEGKIIIDGIDITKIGLHDLRSRLSIIPQDPSLFQGTVRTNLDPLQQHSDSEIWEALNKCCLGEIVRQDPRLLEAPVSEDGENLSVGQRQLVCLARALLKKRRVLILDEATASVDTLTDNLIQKTITEETNNCTVITIAHRIPTVINSELVMVLDDGKIVEYGSPAELLNDQSSAFSKLVMEVLNRSNH